MGDRVLSKNTEGMKFMQRKREADLRAKLQEEQQKDLKDAHWVVNGNGDDLETVVTSGVSEVFTKITSSTGRKSFGKFNREIEKLNQDIAEDNKKALNAWQNKHQPQQEEQKATPKKGNNLGWIRKVQGTGGVDGRMDEGTVTAADMADRFFSIMEADGPKAQQATNTKETKKKKEIKKEKKRAKKRAKEVKEEEGEGGSEEEEEEEEEEGEKSEEGSEEGDEEEGEKSESEEKKRSDDSEESGGSEEESKKDKQKTATNNTNKPTHNNKPTTPNNKSTTPNNKSTTPNNKNGNNNIVVNKKGNTPPSNNKNNNTNNKNNNNNNKNNTQNKGQAKRPLQDANVAALEKQFKKPKI